MHNRIKPIYILLGSLMLVVSACAAEVAGVAPPTSDIAATVTAESTGHEEDESEDHSEDESNHDEEEPSDHDEDGSADVDRVVEVELNEFSIETANLDFEPGETVEFVVTNTGFVEHELRLSNQERVEEHLDGGHADHDETMTDEEMAAMEDPVHEHEEGEADHEDEEAAHDENEADHEDEEAAYDEGEAGHEVDDVVLIVAAGETGTLVFTFPHNASDYTAAVCLIPGHYEAGMFIDLNVNQ